MRYRLCAILVSVGWTLAGCQSGRVTAISESIRISDDITVQPIAEGVWVHKTYQDVPGYGRVAANGLLIIDGAEAMLIDLPWTDAQTGALFDWVAAKHGARIKTVVPTHFHEDCMGGLAEAHRRAAVSYGLDQTIAIARQKDLTVPPIPFQVRIPVRSGRIIASVTYFGPGHTTDNVLAWLPKQRILFGGCLVKSLDAQSLGNIRDGDLAAYPITLRRVQIAYPNARIVVPGHGDLGGPELIDHTLTLCMAKNR